MPANSEKDLLEKVEFLVGTQNNISNKLSVLAKEPFDEEICTFLYDLSSQINKVNINRLPDLATFSFWIRKASIEKLKQRFLKDDEYCRIGRGVVFHVSPSNVPVNFAYSLVVGLISGNANIVRVSSKIFEQVDLIASAINRTLEKYESVKPYINLIRYDREKNITDFFSSVADVRVIWGGDETISEIRKSPLRSRASEVTFADRFSLSVIDSNKYMEEGNPRKVAIDFYNDTYLTDQNACTSPFLVVWTGNKILEAKELFWNSLYDLVKEKYLFQDIQGINKLSDEYIVLAKKENIKAIESRDNLITRMQINELDEDLYEFKGNSGLFFEYDCSDIRELVNICNNVKCQTIGYYGDKNMFAPLLDCHVKGIDRIVPLGKTMDFDLIWDGYDLIDRFTRIITTS